MNHLNDVKLLCNLTRDPALSYTPGGTAVADLGVAVNSRWIGQDGQAKEETCFVDVRVFGKSAEAVNTYLHKGSPALICGRLKLDSWTGQDGQKRSKHRVVADKVIFIPNGNGGGQAAAPAADNGGGSGYQGSNIPDQDIPF